jgi:hypothetical protein
MIDTFHIGLLADDVAVGYEYNFARTSDVLRQNPVSLFVVNGNIDYRARFTEIELVS